MNIIANNNFAREEEGRNGLVKRTELEYHDCGHLIWADVDLSVNGNHTIVCPCGHEHCRVVRNGRITSSRLDQRNGNGITYVGTTSTTSTSWYSGTSTGTSTWVTV